MSAAVLSATSTLAMPPSSPARAPSSPGGASTPSPAPPTASSSSGRPESSLSDEEEGAAQAFLSVVNPWRSARGYEPLPWSSAVKFLMARKFNVERALALYQQHELMRIREGLAVFDPLQSPLKEELLTGMHEQCSVHQQECHFTSPFFIGKFTILPGKDANGATLALFNAHDHDPGKVCHRTTLQGVVYQLDVALESVSARRGKDMYQVTSNSSLRTYVKLLKIS